MRILNPILRTGGIIAHLSWAIAMSALAPLLLMNASIEPPLIAGGLAALALPGIVGVFLARRSASRFGKLVLTILWVALAASLTVVGGGLIGPAACAFLLPVAAIASFSGRASIVEAAAFSGATVMLLLVLQIAGLMPVFPISSDLLTPVFLPAAGLIALGFGLAALRSVRNAARMGRVSREHRSRSRAFSEAPVPIVKTRQGQILAVSDVTREMLPGLPPDVTGLPVKDLMIEDLPQDTNDNGIVGTHIRGAGGTLQPVNVYANSDNVTIILPVAEVANAHETRELISERDRAIQDAQAKTEFLASVSHEIRTPLNAIIGFSDAMKARLFGPVPAKYAEYAELINESGRHLHDLISDVLDLSKIEADSYELKRETFNPRDVIDLCVRMMSQRAAEAGVVIEQAIDPDLSVNADRKALRQILLNLLSNAIKFTPEEGVIVVMAHAKADQFTIAIGDSGPGIPQDELAELGQRYKQASTSDQSTERGSGLGLSLVKALAEMHGGNMNIASTLGEGTTVSVTMPVVVSADTTVTPDEPLEVHSRIERAQTAGQVIASSTGS